MSNKLQNIIEIKATLVLHTGLHIGSGNNEMQIGGLDHEVVRNPITREPYIPGSSLKGKIRTLLEWLSGKVEREPLSLKNIAQVDDGIVCNILRLFGYAGHSENNQENVKLLGIPRLAFWDCNLTKDWKEKYSEDGFIPTEAKTENAIDRITSTTINGGVRQIERVPAGATFDFKLTMRQFKGDSEALVELVLKGLKMLELDSLGGSGSRGYGKIAFTELTIGGVPRSLDDIKPFE